MTVTHGFIDESVRSDGWYRLTMVEVSARDLGSVTRGPFARCFQMVVNGCTSRRKATLDVARFSLR